MGHCIHIDEIVWEKTLWRKFCKYAGRRDKRLVFPEEPVVVVQDTDTMLSDFEANVIVKKTLSDFLDKKKPLKRYYSDDDQKCKLTINTQVYADTYLFLSLRLAILQTDEQATSEIDKHLLNIVLNYNQNYWHYYDFEERLADMLLTEGIKYKDIPVNEICGFIIQGLRSGKYVSVHLDEYYMDRKESQGEIHLVRENLIYGYNNEKREFYAFGFGQREKTQTFIVTYDEMIPAFEKGRLFFFHGAGYLSMDGCYPLNYIQLATPKSFVLTGEYLRERISDFLNPKEGTVTPDDMQVYGAEVYDMILEELKGETTRETIDYRTFHLLWEHKKNVYRCLKEVQQREGIISEELVAKYQKVVNGFQGLRIVYMKEAGITERLIRTKKVHKICGLNERILEIFQREVEREKAVLQEIVIELR